MTTSLEYIADIAPTIDSNIDVAKKNRFINIAQNEINETLFIASDTYNLAVAYYACHLLELSLRNGDSRGVLTAEKEGNLAKSFGTSTKDASVNTTQYFDSYQRLIKNRVPNFYISRGS